MTNVVVRPVFRLLLLVVLLLPGPLHACESLAPADSSEVGRRPPGFSEVYPYADGIEVKVSEVWTGRRLGVAVDPNTSRSSAPSATSATASSP